MNEKKAYELAGCSPAAYDAALEVNLYHMFGDHPTRIIAATMDPKLGVERSVILRDVLDWLRDTGADEVDFAYAEKLERHFAQVPA